MLNLLEIQENVQAANGKKLIISFIFLVKLIIITYFGSAKERLAILPPNNRTKKLKLAYTPKFICESCDRSNHYKAVMKPTTARFKCPGYPEGTGCGAKNLTFQEFFLGSCCLMAAKWTDAVNDKLDKIKFIEFCYEKSQQNVTWAEKKSTEWKNNVAFRKSEVERVSEEFNKKLNEMTKSIRTAESEFMASESALTEAEEASKKLKARMQFLYADLVKSEIEEPAAKLAAKIENDKNSCNICLEKYSPPHRQESALPCGHRSCFLCLSGLEPEICPTCREPFMLIQIYKLF